MSLLFFLLRINNLCPKAVHPCGPAEGAHHHYSYDGRHYPLWPLLWISSCLKQILAYFQHFFLAQFLKCRVASSLGRLQVTVAYNVWSLSVCSRRLDTLYCQVPTYPNRKKKWPRTSVSCHRHQHHHHLSPTQFNSWPDPFEYSKP